MRVVRIVAIGVSIALVTTSCSSPGRGPRAERHTGASTTSSSSGAASSTTAAGGVRTVLSPIGLNIRSQPSSSASVVRTAAQGAVLTVLAHTDQGGGWFEVRGPTVTGWMSDDPSLSAPGMFAAYSSTTYQVSLLYPQGWTAAQVSPTTVAFRAPSGSDTMVVTTATTVGQLGRGRAGYSESNSAQVVVCGITTSLVTYDEVGAPPTTGLPSGVVSEHILAQVRLTLDAQHALGLEANVNDPSVLSSFKDVVYSVSFPFPQCQGGKAGP